MTSISHVPLVSIIIPSHNYAHYLGETLDSVRAQKYRNWECIVVDDGSTDQTADLVAKIAALDSRVRCIQQANRGQSSARNTGLSACTGNYVQFLDADDLIESGKLEQQVNYLEQHREVDIIYGGARYFEDGKKELRYSIDTGGKPWMPEVSGKGKEVMSALVRSNIMVISSPLIRRQVIDLVGPFDERLLFEDWDYWLRCAAKGATFQFEDLAGTLALVRLHPTSSITMERRMLSSSLLVRKKIGSVISDEELLELNRQLTRDLEATVREQEISGALNQIESGQWPKAMAEFARMGLRSRGYRETVKWLFCSLVVPFAPKHDFKAIITDPVSVSILKILRYHFGGSSEAIKR